MKRRLLALVMALALTVGLLPTALAAGELPGYYGDQSQCKMTVQQARTYAELIQGENNALKGETERGSTPRGYAALVDTGCGVPALFWVGVQDVPNEFDLMEIWAWQFQNGTLVSFDQFSWDGIKIYPTHIVMTSSDVMGSTGRAYPYQNGMLSGKSTTSAKDEEGVYTVDGKRTSESAAKRWWDTWADSTKLFCSAKCPFLSDAKVEGFADASAMVAALNSYQGPANTAYASTQSVNIDGKAVSFQMYALKDGSGNLTNYVKVRDLAAALDGTKAQFNVGWNGAVNIETGKPYTTRNGQEGKTPYSGDRAYQKNSAVTNVNGAAADLQAFVLTDDNGGQSTYYKLRDLGRTLGFNVGWNAKGVFIETDKPYTDAD